MNSRANSSLHSYNFIFDKEYEGFCARKEAHSINRNFFNKHVPFFVHRVAIAEEKWGILEDKIIPASRAYSVDWLGILKNNLNVVKTSASTIREALLVAAQFATEENIYGIMFKSDKSFNALKDCKFLNPFHPLTIYELENMTLENIKRLPAYIDIYLYYYKKSCPIDLRIHELINEENAVKLSELYDEIQTMKQGLSDNFEIHPMESTYRREELIQVTGETYEDISPWYLIGGQAVVKDYILPFYGVGLVAVKQAYNLTPFYLPNIASIDHFPPFENKYEYGSYCIGSAPVFSTEGLVSLGYGNLLSPLCVTNLKQGWKTWLEICKLEAGKRLNQITKQL